MNLQLRPIQSGTAGINSAIWFDGREICKTIELPYRDNQRRVSSIPAGQYRLTRRYSQKFKHHILVNGVPNRDLILIHPANNALKELNGCIAPVSIFTGIGRGASSRIAFERLRNLVFAAIDSGVEVWLNVLR